MDTLRHHAPYKYSEFCWGHHGSAGVVVGNTIQVILGAHIFPLVAFWLKREIGSRDLSPQVPCSFLKFELFIPALHACVPSWVFVVLRAFCAAALPPIPA